MFVYSDTIEKKKFKILIIQMKQFVHVSDGKPTA